MRRLGTALLVATAFAPLGSGCSNEPLAIERAPILGGHEVAPGAWPTVAWLDEGCSATLVDPEVVLYAAHCGTDIDRVWFGDAVDVAVSDQEQTLDVRHAPNDRSVAVARCAVYPGAEIGSGMDLAYCVLDEPVLDLPSIPPALGCEQNALAVGASATLVGFGFGDVNRTGLGAKRTATAALAGVEQEIEIGDTTQGTCAGDSGGPAYVRVPSAIEAGWEWRLLGVLSSGLQGEDCGRGFYTNVGHFAAWLTQETQRDLAPCFDAKAAWHPRAGCRVPAVDDDGSTAPSVAFSATCGEPYVAKLSGGAISEATPGGGCSFVAGATVPTSMGATYLFAGLCLAGAGYVRKRRSRRQVFLASCWLGWGLVACGGSTHRDQDSSIGSLAGAAGMPPSTPDQTPCTDVAPSVGDRCASEGWICSYGDSPRFDCKDLYTCTTGRWNLTDGSCARAPSGYCPAQKPAGQPCTALDENGSGVSRGAGAACTYASSVCLCYGCTSRMCDHGQSTWECSEPPATAGCPPTPPNLGAACAAESLECTYGDACQASGHVVACERGVWAAAGPLCPE